METADKTMLQNILAHQLEGIMFHFDMMSIYALLNQYCSMVNLHRKKFEEESACHAKFTLYLIKQYHEILPPSDLQRVIIIEDENSQTTIIKDSQGNSVSVNNNKNVNILTEVPTCVLEQQMLHKKMLQIWEKWEDSTITLYNSALNLFPNHSVLKKLLSKAECELKIIQKYLKQM